MLTAVPHSAAGCPHRNWHCYQAVPPAAPAAWLRSPGARVLAADWDRLQRCQNRLPPLLARDGGKNRPRVQGRDVPERTGSPSATARGGPSIPIPPVLASRSEGEGAAPCLPSAGLLYCFSDFRKSLGCKRRNASPSTLVNLNNYLLKHPARSPLHYVCSDPPALCVITAVSIGTTSITSLRFWTPAQGLYLSVWSIAYIFNLSIISQDLGLSAAEVLCSMRKVKSLKQGHVYGLS